MGATPERQFRTVPIIPPIEKVRGQLTREMSDFVNAMEQFFADEWPTIDRHLQSWKLYHDESKSQYLRQADALRAMANQYHDLVQDIRTNPEMYDRKQLEDERTLLREAKHYALTGFDTLRRILPRGA